MLLKSVQNNRGGALMITLAIMLMLTIVAIMALDRSTTDVDLSYNQLHNDQAFYTAQAGIERAHAALNNDRTWDSGYVNVSLGRGYYSVTVTDSNDILALKDTVVLRAVGVVDAAEARVEAWLVPEKFYPFEFALFGDTIVTMSNSSCTDSYNSDSGSYAATLDHTLATVGSNDSLILSNIASVGGDAISAIEDGVVVYNKALVRGDTLTGVAPRPLDEVVDDSEFEWALDNSAATTSISGGYTYDDSTYALTVAANQTAVLGSGVYYFSDILIQQNGHIDLAPGAEVVIYMTGDLTLRNSSSFNAGGIPSHLIIYSSGDLLTIGQNTELTAAFYGPNAEFTLDNYTEFYGSVVARKIDFSNNVCFHYDRSLSQIEKGETGKFVVVAWREY